MIPDDVRSDHSELIQSNCDYDYKQLVGDSISNRLSATAEKLIKNSWRAGSKKTYATYIKKWESYAQQNIIDFLQPSEQDVANFLALLFEQQLSYSAVKTARAAVASVIICDYSDSRILKHLMKGVFEERPVLRRDVIWDVKPVLNYFTHLFPAKSLSLKLLTVKTAVLLALVMNQRQQGLELVDLRNMTLEDHKITIRYGDVMKNTGPQFHQPEISIKAYIDKRICPVWYIWKYLAATNKVRNSTKLFIITQKPYRAASKSTIGKWIKKGLALGGVDMSIFTPHSTRSAAGSARRRTNVPLDTILATAGWASAKTFAKYYNKEIKRREASVQQLL